MNNFTNTDYTDLQNICWYWIMIAFVIPATLIVVITNFFPPINSLNSDNITTATKDTATPTSKVVKCFNVACAESCTGGNVSAFLTSMSGSSNWYHLGQTTYHIDEKVDKLAVNRENAEMSNCVNEQVAYEMSKGLLDDGHAINVTTTGYVGTTDESHIPFYWVGICSRFEHNAIRIGVDVTKIDNKMIEQLGLSSNVTQRVLCQKFMAWYAVKLMDWHFSKHKNEFLDTFPDDKAKIELFEATINSITKSVTGEESVVALML
jgi:PncC family amidohydrolase